MTNLRVIMGTDDIKSHIKSYLDFRAEKLISNVETWVDMEYCKAFGGQTGVPENFHLVRGPIAIKAYDLVLPIYDQVFKEQVKKQEDIKRLIKI
ncbi:MAG: hypothetical protein JJ975_05990 [Bacteroidia bacterium]|nr:hypothetical protein [Bacteroidia bacterium]